MLRTMKQSSRIEKDDMRACFIQGGQGRLLCGGDRGVKTWVKTEREPDGCLVAGVWWGVGTF